MTNHMLFRLYYTTGGISSVTSSMTFLHDTHNDKAYYKWSLLVINACNNVSDAIVNSCILRRLFMPPQSVRGGRYYVSTVSRCHDVPPVTTSAFLSFIYLFCFARILNGFRWNLGSNHYNQEPEELSTSFFWWRPLIEVQAVGAPRDYRRYIRGQEGKKASILGNNFGCVWWI